MNPEALILRRCYPVPVTLADLRAAYPLYCADHGSDTRAEMLRYRRRSRRQQNVEIIVRRADGVLTTLKRDWSAALKDITSALDEVYAVVDGREVRVATTDGEIVQWTGGMDPSTEHAHGSYRDLLDKADREGYWERPHEVRLDLSPRPVSHGEVARAVLVGQEALERGGVVRT